MTILNNYIDLVKNLDSDSKIALIAHLSNSILEEKMEKSKVFSQCFGAIDTEESGEELVDITRNSRIFREKIIEL